MPKRVPVAERRDEQLLIRVTRVDMDWLESAAHLDRASVNSYVYALLRAHVAGLRTNPFVLADFKNRQAYDEQTTATIPLAQREQPPLAETPPGDGVHGESVP